MDRRSAMIAMGGAAIHTGMAAPASAMDDPALVDLTRSAKPITPGERIGRIERLQARMRKASVGAILVEAGSSLDYFTGIKWWRSERLTAVVIPADGEPLVVTPFFEAPSIQEMLAVPAHIRTWQEHESPYRLVAGWLQEKHLDAASVLVEETVRAFIQAELGAALPSARVTTDLDLVRAVRMRKSPAEIALMQVANTITLNALAYAARRTQVGMTPADIVALVVAATRQQGGQSDGGLVLLGEASAYPHGSRQHQEVREGEVVLMDCGCSVHGYSSDISRSFVLGEPDAQLRRVWGMVRQGQQIAHETAKIGVACGEIDDAVRRYYEKEGFGPGYRLPGLSHRTGHGIGMDGHEPVNLVHNEKTPMEVGMCFSNEPGLYLPGKFGVRLEDCFYMTAEGPRLFTPLASSIDKVFG